MPGFTNVFWKGQWGNLSGSNQLQIDFFIQQACWYLLNHLNEAWASLQPSHECISSWARSIPLCSYSSFLPPSLGSLFCATSDLATPDDFQGLNLLLSQPYSLVPTQVIHHLRMFTPRTRGMYFFLTHLTSPCAEKPNKGFRCIKQFTTPELKGQAETSGEMSQGSTISMFAE